ncbi:CR3L4 protein, partial [Atractosteus spatula]|nr:CR3L4 protein [Atractosteus spatula]
MDISGYLTEMDAESGRVFFGQQGEEEEEVMAESSLGAEGPFSYPEALCGGAEKTLEEWALDPHCGLNDSESEDILHAMINPNEVYPSSGAPLESPSESDSGISEDPRSDSPPGGEPAPGGPPCAPPAVYQVVYDISGLDGVRTEPAQRSVDVISIELDAWNSQMLIPESCIVNELPMIPAGKPGTSLPSPAGPGDSHIADNFPLYPELCLTEEEQKLLTQEGVSLPNNLPLTKAEERILKKVRRKIRNKQSAQDSRRRKKEYIDGLESRVAACSAQNQELQRTVEQLEKHNMSLLAQLRRLQSLIKQTATKAAQTSTCIMIIIFSLALILFPSYSPFRWGPAAAEEPYAPRGVISRNILTDSAASHELDVGHDIEAGHDLPPSSAVGGQSDDPGPPPVLFQQPIAGPEAATPEGAVQEQSQPRNGSLKEEGRTNELAMSLAAGKGQGPASADSAKPAHADEM